MSNGYILEFILYTILMSFVSFCAMLPLIYFMVDLVFGTHFLCKRLGWHNGRGKGTNYFDGCSYHAICSKCGKNVMQDSQGNWF